MVSNNGFKVGDIYDLISQGIKKPDFPQGNALLCIKRCEGQASYGNNNDRIVKVICEDEFGNELIQTFFIKNGIANNLVKFVCEALGFEPVGEFNIKQLEGKSIKAIITHYYNDNGIGYANIVFCEPA